MKILNKESFEKVIKENKYVLVDFYANWCGPCKMLQPILEQFDSIEDNCFVGKINVDDEETLAWQFGISSIPTIIFFKDGKACFKEIGYRTIDQLKVLFNKLQEN